ncbi:MAG: TerB family tellurite resistance protein, partial [Candidatus Eremiobacteraeota bacterium]|nr:TerB family tellurite resistance protein [Candidatus Eremiobacteraeota bacterium]
AVDAVACPKCGWFQAGMVSEVKWNWGCGMWIGLIVVAGLASLVDVFWGAATLYVKWPWMLGGSVVLGVLTYMATNPNNGYHEVHGHSQRALGSRGVVLEDSRSDDELQTELYDCLRAAMLSMAGIDGVIDPEELAAVARIYEQVTDKPVQVADLEREGRAAMGRHQATLESLAKLAPYLQFQGKAMFIRAVLVIASADGHIDDSEWKLLAAIGAALEMDAGQVKSVVEEMAG